MAIDAPEGLTGLLHPKLLEDAAGAHVVWARVKGYPYWPAQVLGDSAAQKKLGKVAHRKNLDVPVMFFGTLEIAWIGQADIVSFRDGVHNGYLSKAKHKSFLKACGQVLEFLWVDKKRKAPQYWWCRPPGAGSGVDADDEDARPSSKPGTPGGKGKSRAGGKPSASGDSDSDSGSSDGEEASSAESEKQEAGRGKAGGPRTQRGRKGAAAKGSSRAQAGGDTSDAESSSSEEDQQGKGAKPIKENKRDNQGGSTSTTDNEADMEVDGGKQAGPQKSAAVPRSKQAHANGRAAQRAPPRKKLKSEPLPSSAGADGTLAPAVGKAASDSAGRTVECPAGTTAVQSVPPQHASSAPLLVAAIVEAPGQVKQEPLPTMEPAALQPAVKDAPNASVTTTAKLAELPAAAPAPPPPPPPPSLSDDQDISKLPAEIRRLAGIKLEKKRPAQSAPAQPKPVAVQPKAEPRDEAQEGSKGAADVPTPSCKASLPLPGSEMGEDALSPGKRETRSAHTSSKPTTSKGGEGKEKPSKASKAEAGGEESKQRKPKKEKQEKVEAAAPAVPAAAAAGGSAGTNSGTDREAQLQRKRERERERRQALKQARQRTAASTADAGAAARAAADSTDSDEPGEQLEELLPAGALTNGSHSKGPEAGLSAGTVPPVHPKSHALPGTAKRGVEEGESAGPSESAGTAVVGDGNSQPSRKPPRPSRGAAVPASSRSLRGGRAANNGPSSAAAGAMSTAASGPFHTAGPTSSDSKDVIAVLESAAALASSGKGVPAVTTVAAAGFTAVSSGLARKGSAPPSLTSAQPTALEIAAASAILPSRHHHKRSSDSMLAATSSACAPASTTSGTGAGEHLHGSSEQRGQASSAQAAEQSQQQQGGGAKDEDMLDAEAAEALQFMQSMDAGPVVNLLPTLPGMPSLAGMATDSSGAVVGASTGGAAQSLQGFNSASLEARVTINLEDALAGTPSTSYTPSYKVPRVTRDKVPADFKWPQLEPVVPPHPDIFRLPGPWLQARPPQYETIPRNLWVSKQRPKRLMKSEINVCMCRPTPPPNAGDPNGPPVRWGCQANCLNRVSMFFCDPKSCPCGEACSNRPFHRLRKPRMEPFLTPNRGYGVRALQRVPAGTFMLEYVGEVIDTLELARRMEEARSTGEPCYYIMELDTGTFIDARRKGNLARLLNSSCNPNCETQKWFDAATGEPRVGIFSKRDIEPGEELTYDYFFQHYGAHLINAASFQCKCGAPNCRGTMDTNPEKRKDVGRRVEVFWDADGMYYHGTIVGYSSHNRRHTILYDDGDEERVCLDEVPHRWLEDDPLMALKHFSMAAGLQVAGLTDVQSGGGEQQAGGPPPAGPAHTRAPQVIGYRGRVVQSDEYDDLPSYGGAAEEEVAAGGAGRGGGRSIMGAAAYVDVPARKKPRSGGYGSGMGPGDAAGARLPYRGRERSTSDGGGGGGGGAGGLFGDGAQNLETLLQAVESELVDKEAQAQGSGSAEAGAAEDLQQLQGGYTHHQHGYGHELQHQGGWGGGGHRGRGGVRGRERTALQQVGAVRSPARRGAHAGGASATGWGVVRDPGPQMLPHMQQQQHQGWNSADLVNPIAAPPLRSHMNGGLNLPNGSNGKLALIEDLLGIRISSFGLPLFQQQPKLNGLHGMAGAVSSAGVQQLQPRVNGLHLAGNPGPTTQLGGGMGPTHATARHHHVVTTSAPGGPASVPAPTSNGHHLHVQVSTNGLPPLSSSAAAAAAARSQQHQDVGGLAGAGPIHQHKRSTSAPSNQGPSSGLLNALVQCPTLANLSISFGDLQHGGGLPGLGLPSLSALGGGLDLFKRNGSSSSSTGSGLPAAANGLIAATTPHSAAGALQLGPTPAGPAAIKAASAAAVLVSTPVATAVVEPSLPAAPVAAPLQQQPQLRLA